VTSRRAGQWPLGHNPARRFAVVGTNPYVLRISRKLARACRDAQQGCAAPCIPEHPGRAVA
jgi:hypothetical protein